MLKIILLLIILLLHLLLVLLLFFILILILLFIILIPILARVILWCQGLESRVGGGIGDCSVTEHHCFFFFSFEPLFLVFQSLRTTALFLLFLLFKSILTTTKNQICRLVLFTKLRFHKKQLKLLPNNFTSHFSKRKLFMA